ncbi:P-loop containing nucleoside triphosphate hydrolase protein [Bisporella sp. PMI_857]|nr:P-loop containing nucleoside triphosphate hydrolase protein [Bisporella sp. PMI_857]
MLFSSSAPSPTIQNVSLAIVSGEKIGICGGTGSGKSFLLSDLLRILDNTSGSVLIDGLDLSTIPRDTIRSRLVAVPQEPLILAATIRFNTDPTSSSSDSLIISALKSDSGSC